MSAIVLSSTAFTADRYEEEVAVIDIDQATDVITVEHVESGVEYQVRFHHFSNDRDGDLRVDLTDAVQVSS
jgi:hypothetical protein